MSLSRCVVFCHQLSGFCRSLLLNHERAPKEHPHPGVATWTCKVDCMRLLAFITFSKDSVSGIIAAAASGI